MSLEIQFKLKQNKYYLPYLRSHSYWYKYLTRYPESFSNFDLEVKKFYHLRLSDKLNDAINTIDTITSIVSTLNS